MNISFHYFAVKTLARKAGFDEISAQQIAVFSQFIDDYNAYLYRRYSNVPDWAKQAPYDMYISSWTTPFNFNPVTTGFWDWMDLATLVTPRSQKFTVSPFHFIPSSHQSMTENDNRTFPATLNDGTIISDHLNLAKNEFINAAAETDRMNALMLIGSRLHTFADTYAHQLFSGYNEKCNNVTLVQVINNMTGEDETNKYNTLVYGFLQKMQDILQGHQPAIGHMMIEHIPDYPWISFTMNYPLPDGGTGTHTRSNTSEFVRASKEIMDYLRSCLNLPPISGTDWEQFTDKLVLGFFFDETLYSDEGVLIRELVKHWSSIFGQDGCLYSYDRHALFDGIIGGYSSRNSSNESLEMNNNINSIFPAMSDAFYFYNAYADHLLVELYGSQPRSAWFNVVEEDSAAHMCPIENPDDAVGVSMGKPLL
nr:DUF6765 family protein [uncultured Clostridium sp.]